MNYLIAAYGVTAVSLAAYTLHLVRERLRARESASRARETNNG